MYENRQYWQLLHERADLTTVGQSGLPEHLNRWIYRSIRRNVKNFARRYRLRPRRLGHLLDVGVGTGYWIDFWADRGWQVDGCDLVPAAVDRLRIRYPDARFWSSDVSSEEGLLGQSVDQIPRSYELITALSVLLHVTRDEDFSRALTNLAEPVEPGGFLLLMEPVLLTTKKQPEYDPAKHSRARILRSYVEPLEALGMDLIGLEATTVLAANPLEGGSPRRRAVYATWWRAVASTRQHPRRAILLGPVMYLADAVLMRSGESPTSKLMLFRKRDVESS